MKQPMNPRRFVAPVFQPASRADWKVSVTGQRFMESPLSRLRMKWDHEPDSLPGVRNVAQCDRLQI